jgi:uncharacterized protein (DUF1330 family)
MSESITIDGDLEALLPDVEGPITMVNLLRFEPGGGSKAYGEYAAAFASLLEEAGGTFLYRGRVEATLVGDETWHAVALVTYPSREAFLKIARSDAYRSIHPLRERGLAATRLFATRAYPQT